MNCKTLKIIERITLKQHRKSEYFWSYQ